MTSGAGRFTLRLAAGYRLYLGLGLAVLAPFVASGATPDRAVPESVATAPAQAADPELHHRLTGIVVSPALHEAIFTANGETRAIHEGQQIDGWTLTAIAPNDVTLQAAGETLHLAPEGDAAWCTRVASASASFNLAHAPSRRRAGPPAKGTGSGRSDACRADGQDADAGALSGSRIPRRESELPDTILSPMGCYGQE